MRNATPLEVRFILEQAILLFHSFGVIAYFVTPRLAAASCVQESNYTLKFYQVDLIWPVSLASIIMSRKMCRNLASVIRGESETET